MTQQSNLVIEKPLLNYTSRVIKDMKPRLVYTAFFLVVSLYLYVESNSNICIVFSLPMIIFTITLFTAIHYQKYYVYKIISSIDSINIEYIKYYKEKYIIDSPENVSVYLLQDKLSKYTSLYLKIDTKHDVIKQYSRIEWTDDDLHNVLRELS